MSEHLLEEFAIRDDLRRALTNDELFTVYQPKYRVTDRSLVGAEALVRWHHPSRGLLSPAVFVSVAERCGLIDELETAVLEQVCRDLRFWLDAGYRVHPVSVNLSAARILDDDLPEQVQQTLRRYRLDPGLLMFEITETLALQELDTALKILKRFHEIGIAIALDDFGTGYSSLAYLKRLPIQQVKIDRSFIWDLEDGGGEQVEIVRAIVHLAHALSLDVIAEGVESETHMQILRELHCDEVQGFLLNRPLLEKDYSNLLAYTTAPAMRAAL